MHTAVRSARGDCRFVSCNQSVIYGNKTIETTKHSLANRANDVVTMECGAGWALETSEGTVGNVHNCLTTVLCTCNQHKIILNTNCNLKILQSK